MKNVFQKIAQAIAVFMGLLTVAFIVDASAGLELLFVPSGSGVYVLTMPGEYVRTLLVSLFVVWCLVPVVAVFVPVTSRDVPPDKS